MAIDTGRVGILTDLLVQSGVPVLGISFVNETIPTVSVQYNNATSEQIATANNIIAQFDWRRRRPLTRNTIVTALQSLTTAQRNSLLLHLLAQLFRDRPEYAAAIGTFLGTPVAVDEVDPT